MLNFAYKKQEVEKIGAGVQKFGGKNPENGKNLGGGCNFGLTSPLPEYTGHIIWLFR